MAKKITAADNGVKISELGEELKVDPRQIVAAAKEMAMENAKVPASWVTHGQAERLRAKFGGQKHIKAALERRQRAKEESLNPTPVETETPKPKLGKKTFEADRRTTFGVVETAGGIKIEPRPKESNAKSIQTVIKKPAESSPSSSSAPSEFALPPPKKVLEIKVAPPVRREQGTPDPRFGVVQPAPKSEAPATSSDQPPVKDSSGMWDKLNDGRTQPAFASSTTVDSSEPESEPEPEPEPAEVEPVAELKNAADLADAMKAPAPESVPEVVAEAAPSKRAPEPDPAPTAEVHAPRHDHKHHHHKRHEEVPVKRQPEHKAFGSKHKLKAKKHKQLKSAPSKPEQPRKEKPAKPAAASHAHESKPKPPARAEERPVGLLQRIVRKLFKK